MLVQLVLRQKVEMLSAVSRLQVVVQNIEESVSFVAEQGILQRLVSSRLRQEQ